MIIDSSALIAVIAVEPEAQSFVEAMLAAPVARLSAGSWIELAAVITRRRAHGYALLTELVDRVGITIEPVTAEQAQIGHDAYRRYGIGTGHPARLNFGDCFAYALAKALGEPLLFKGGDFARTDVTPAR
ncbi:MAG: ribonuclease [Proteobacteria bacterium SG_bin5]|nr:type II toxin-antitoxin system VapC family toxin [Sphingomonas sp.]OQW42448.1 MAG: ribonuclease [Proteobacteria bacterium SG_bin5]